MQYVFLLGAIISEVVGTSALKLSDGFSKLWPSVIVVLAYGLSFFLLSLTLKRMGVGTAYAIWSGLGTALIVIIGILYFKEDVSVLKITSILLIVIGVIGLNLGKIE
jgi:small multidrug resistance pump